METATSFAPALRSMTTSKARRKTLFIRLDKIGDLVCTMPTDEVFDNAYEKIWVLSKGMGEIATAAIPPRRFIELDKNNWKESSQKFSEFLETEKPDLAISFQAPWWIHYQLWKHRVPQRVGVKSQWHSFLFLNHGLRQKRSQAEKHEFQYNLELAHLALKINRDSITSKEPILKLKAPMVEWPRPSTTGYIVVHPGMAGSALNWQQSQYISWMDRFLNERFLDIYISGTPADEPYLDQIKAHFQNHPRVHVLQSKLNFQQMLAMLESAEFVLAPSTGVAHLAASLGTAVKAIFSPVRVQSPRRWQPRGPRVQIYLPQVGCPAAFRCLGEACRYYNCMNQVQVDTKSPS